MHWMIRGGGEKKIFPFFSSKQIPSNAYSTYSCFQPFLFSYEPFSALFAERGVNWIYKVFVMDNFIVIVCPILKLFETFVCHPSLKILIPGMIQKTIPLIFLNFFYLNLPLLVLIMK